MGNRTYEGRKPRRKVAKVAGPFMEPSSAWLNGGQGGGQDHSLWWLPAAYTDAMASITTGDGEDVGDDLPLEAGEPSPEENADRLLRWQALSNEARDVVSIILEGPSEALNLMCDAVRSSPTPGGIKRFLVQHRGLSRKEADERIAEIREHLRGTSR